MKRMVVVPAFPQPLLIINHLQTSGAKSGAKSKETLNLGRFFLCLWKRKQARFTTHLQS